MNLFDLVELQFDRRLASEHLDDDFDLLFFEVDRLDRPDERLERSVDDFDGVALGDVEVLRADLFESHTFDLFGREHLRFALRSDETGHPADVGDHIPEVVVEDHPPPSA